MPEHCTWGHASLVNFRATQVGPEAISRPLEMPSVLNQE